MARQSIYLDPIHPQDFRTKNPIFCCEQCSHFDPQNERCTIGYNANNHRRETQLKIYEISGRMAFCRTLEID